MALAAAPHIPGFRALSPLGYGPTSTIFSAQSDALGRWVALTVYSTTLVDDRSQRRFLRAFETARRLGAHPHAVTMLEAGLTPERQPYVASEAYERGTLEARIGSRPQPLEVDEVLAVGIALAGALETAHRAGVIHGGLHPGRVLIDGDRVPAIADMNLVPLVEGGLATLVGPRHHVPPEVLEGEDVTPATDVFSLASTMYMALTQRPPYQGDDPESDTAASLLLRMLQRSATPLGRPDAPPSLEQRLAQALDSQAANRPATPLAFATLLQQIQQELGLPVTEPIVLDVQPAASLSVADEPEPRANGTSPDAATSPLRRGLAPDPALPRYGEATPLPQRGLEDAPDQRVFVPYQPSDGEPGSPVDGSPLAGVSDFPAPPEAPAEPASYEPVGYQRPSAAETGYQEPAADPYASSDQWPWDVQEDVDSYDPQPSSVAILESPAYPRPTGVPAPPAGAAHDLPDQAAAAPADDADPARPASATRALPVIVLMSLVAVLIVGVGWMIVTGEDPSQSSASTTQSSAALDEDGVVSPDSVTAVENGSGVQIDWDGSSDEAQVVVVLSETDGPRTLPAETGSALLVDAAQLTAGTGYCFAVAPASPPTGDGAGAGSSSPSSAAVAPSAAAITADLGEDAVGPNACIRGATPDSVRRA
jgi:eukaryotic-like serine/threonine-protein kinase